MLTPEIILLKTPSEQFAAGVEIVSRKNTSYLKQKMLMARRDVKLSLLSPAGRNVCRTKYEAGTLDFTPNCSLDLLRQQKRHMGEYLHDLEIRAEVEGIEL